MGITALLDRHFDLYFGTDTRDIVENADLLDVVGRNLAHGIRYQPTPAIPFRRLVRASGISVAGAFVDLGCGKGRTLVLAAVAGFPRLVGVEHSAALCRIAERNLATIRKRTGRRFETFVHAMDAVEYAFSSDDTVVYLYNPFDASILRIVMAHLRESLATVPRSVWVIYHNPVWRSVIEEDGFFQPVHDYSFGGCEFAVYVNSTGGLGAGDLRTTSLVTPPQSGHLRSRTT